MLLHVSVATSQGEAAAAAKLQGLSNDTTVPKSPGADDVQAEQFPSPTIELPLLIPPVRIQPRIEVGPEPESPPVSPRLVS
jgi:hypothetical protein